MLGLLSNDMRGLLLSEGYTEHYVAADLEKGANELGVLMISFDHSVVQYQKCPIFLLKGEESEERKWAIMGWS